MSITKEVIAKWRVSQADRVVESNEEFDALVELATASLVESKTKLAKMEMALGSDTKSVLESMLNTDEAIEAIAMCAIHEGITIDESIVKHVNALGVVTRTKDRKTRERLATQTTGLSKSTRRKIARKAAKTKRANPSGQVKSLRKRKKALKKRRQMGL